jgi:hypothetical protein
MSRLDPLLITAMELRAKANALYGTGMAYENGITVRYYPRCGRYAWFNEDGVVTKAYARYVLTCPPGGIVE